MTRSGLNALSEINVGYGVRFLDSQRNALAKREAVGFNSRDRKHVGSIASAVREVVDIDG